MSTAKEGMKSQKKISLLLRIKYRIVHVYDATKLQPSL